MMQTTTSTTFVHGKVEVREIKNPISPLALFRSIGSLPNSFFLDSALLRKGLSRYSFLGWKPFLVIKTKGNEITLRDSSGAVQKQGNPFEELRHLLKAFQVEEMDTGIPFIGGAVGYLAYDLCHFIEHLPSSTLNDIEFPEMYFGFYDSVVAYDHSEKRCFLVGRNLDEVSKERTLRLLHKSSFGTAISKKTKGRSLKGNFSKERYLESVRRAKEYISQGDIYQINLSQRFETEIDSTAQELYLRLRKISPAPFSSCICFDDKAIVSSSPERFLRLSSGRVQTRPIKGTRPRGHNPETDHSLMQELLHSPKDNAELTMIVDLERNDLGRVCNYGSIRVVEKKVLEAYPTVFHLVATVEGDLHPRYDPIDLLKATFPGGSVTGVPKIRAMEIIDELEPTRRSVYTGALGYIGFNGDMDLSIAIRTFLVRGSTVFFQVGGGIVADSDPEEEYNETMHKARALIDSLKKR